MPEIRESAQLLQLIALGRTIAVLPESARRHLRSNLAAVPVLDGPITTIHVASPERSRAVTVFVRAASLTVGRWLDQVGSHDEWA
jgi:DNA-binding transcriptional LysR family regulator